MSEKKYGFVYIWRDRKNNRYYIGCHWGSVDDGYICSSNWMRKAYRRRPEDFRRRILKTNIQIREDIYKEEQRFFDMMKPEEIKVRYYNLNLKSNPLWHAFGKRAKSIGQKISAAKKGKSTGPCSPEKAKKISEAKKAKNRKMTPEAKEKMIAKKKGNTLTKEHKKKISDGLLKGKERKVRPRLSPEDLHEARMKSQTIAISALSGSKRYNNGQREVSSKVHPGSGWNLGRLPKSDEYKKNFLAAQAMRSDRLNKSVVNNFTSNNL